MIKPLNILRQSLDSVGKLGYLADALLLELGKADLVLVRHVKQGRMYLSSEDLVYLRNNPDLSIREMAAYLKKPYALTKSIVGYYCIPHRNERGLTREQKLFIGANYQNMRIKLMADLLGISDDAVGRYCRKQGLQKKKRLTAA